MTERERSVALLVPVAAILFIPGSGGQGVNTRLISIFVELLVGLPCLLVLSANLRPAVIPLRSRVSWFWAMPLLISLALAFQLLYAILGLLIPVPEAYNTLLWQSWQSGSPTESALLFLSVLLVAPLMEETFFRGFVPWLWISRFGRRGSLIVPALFFALMHLNPWHVAELFLLALALGLLRDRLDSLVPAMALHAINNLLSLILLQSRASGLQTFINPGPGQLPWLAFLCATPGVVWLFLLVRTPAHRS